tara:strand:+ start:380 stop:673 length:294 start_codon:yes stop_codon:yes gene_type:complete
MTTPIKDVEQFILERLVRESTDKQKTQNKDYTLRASLKSDLNLALFALKLRKIISSHGSIKKNEKKKEYTARVKSSLRRNNLKNQVRDFYGNFVTVK